MPIKITPDRAKGSLFGTGDKFFCFLLGRLFGFLSIFALAALKNFEMTGLRSETNFARGGKLGREFLEIMLVCCYVKFPAEPRVEKKFPRGIELAQKHLGFTTNWKKHILSLGFPSLRSCSWVRSSGGLCELHRHCWSEKSANSLIIG